ncbi:MAG: AMP-binding protein [Burkholderiales bacterium]
MIGIAITSPTPDGMAVGGAASNSLICLDDGRRTWTRGALDAQVQAFAERLSAQGTRVLATLLDNSPAWVVADLAAARAGLVHVPLPVFFTPAQIAHALHSAGVDSLLTSPEAAASWPQTADQPIELAHQHLVMLQRPSQRVAMPPGTAYGCNVSPEWVETALHDEHAIAQAVMFGEARPSLSAVLWPVQPDAPDAVLQAAVDSANTGLPDYARVRRWVRASATFDAASGLATANGRPQRDAIWQRHANALADRCQSAAVYHLALR